MADRGMRAAERSDDIEQLIIEKVRSGQPHLHHILALKQKDLIARGRIRPRSELRKLSELAYFYDWVRTNTAIGHFYIQTLFKIGEAECALQELATNPSAPYGPENITGLVTHLAKTNSYNAVFETLYSRSPDDLHDNIHLDVTTELILAQGIKARDKYLEVAEAATPEDRRYPLWISGPISSIHLRMREPTPRTPTYKPDSSAYKTEAAFDAIREADFAHAGTLLSQAYSPGSSKYYLHLAIRYIAEHHGNDAVDTLRANYAYNHQVDNDHRWIGLLRGNHCEAEHYEVPPHFSRDENYEAIAAIAYHKGVQAAEEFSAQRTLNQNGTALAIMCGMSGLNWYRQR